MTVGEVAPSLVEREVVRLDRDRSLAFARCGAGRDCVLVHGTLMTLEDPWIGLAPALAPVMRVTSVDRPGHGLSRRRRLVDASPFRQAALIRDGLRATGVERPVILGHSYGGTVALAYAVSYPDEIAGVVALAPMCLPEPRPEPLLFGARAAPGWGDVLARVAGVTTDPAMLQSLWHAMFRPQVMPAAFCDAFPFALAARFEQMVSEGEDAMVLAPVLAGMAARYAACRVPVRILGGTGDIVVRNGLQGLVAARLLPNARMQPADAVGDIGVVGVRQLLQREPARLRHLAEVRAEDPGDAVAGRDEPVEDMGFFRRNA